MDFSAGARRLGIGAAGGIVALGLAYAIVLVVGLLALPSQHDAITGRLFSGLELLILPLAPLAVVLMVAVHARTPPDLRAFSMCALVFMSMLAVLTCTVHFVILTVGHQLAIDDAASAFEHPRAARVDAARGEDAAEPEL